MEEYLAHEEKYKGYRIKVYQDPDPEDPRNCENLGKMVCFHKRYTLGDETDLKSSMFNGWEELENYLIKEKQAEVIASLYMYDHSGLSIKIGDFYGCGLPQGHARFDSGQIGFIYVDKETLLIEYGVKRITKKVKDKARKDLEAEVDTYNSYVSGQVYGFEVVNKEEEQIDISGGIYDIAGAIKEAKENIDYYIKEQRKKKKREVIVRR